MSKKTIIFFNISEHFSIWPILILTTLSQLATIAEYVITKIKASIATAGKKGTG
jgi:hypothetical protein